MTIKEIRATTGLSRRAFSEITNIPLRTMENWESGTNPPPPYLVTLLEYYAKHELAKKTS